MDDQNKNLILATVLSLLVILVWTIFFAPPPAEIDQGASPTAEQIADGSALPPVAEAGEVASAVPETTETGTDITDSPRLEIATPELAGSIALVGGRIDDLQLLSYRETLQEGSPNVTLLSPAGAPGGFLTYAGWVPGGDLAYEDVPGPDTLWQAEEGATLTPQSPVTLRWTSPSGLVFERVIAVDDAFMFTMTQRVTNPGETTFRLAPYGVVERHGLPDDLRGFFIIHEGAMLQSGESLEEIDYADMTDFETDATWGPASQVTEVAGNGWLGFTDHYWMTTLIPQAETAFTAVLQYDARRDIYKSTARLPVVELGAGDTAETETRIFAGAKEWETIRDYEDRKGIYKFIDAIDWGWFYFLTKPIFWMLHTLNGLIGNMGWAIIGLTLFIKAILLPLAYKSYVSMAKMKELQPEMEKLKERAGDDRQKLQQEMMELYKKEKVNPAAGCLPILLQIPIFFSLYKVIFVTIELRHAGWLGPFRDLSAPDPTSIFNFYGLFPWEAPEPTSLLALIFIGILPLILGISMWLQQKLNPAPTDPTQAAIFAWMPWVFMFMLGGFASGLVVYWIANNVITFAQQYAIMRSQGYTPDVFGNIKAGFKRDKSEDGT